MNKMIISMFLGLFLAGASASATFSRENPNHMKTLSEWQEFGFDMRLLIQLSEVSAYECESLLREAGVPASHYLVLKHHLKNYFFDEMDIVYGSNSLTFQIRLPDSHFTTDCSVQFNRGGGLEARLEELEDLVPMQGSAAE